jgi:hypothetical protein
VAIHALEVAKQTLPRVPVRTDALQQRHGRFGISQLVEQARIVGGD